MFEDIGNKLKITAKVLFILGTIACVIAGFSIITNADEVYLIDEDTLTTYGWTILIAGPASCWINGCILYGFGELVENSAMILGRLEKTDAKKDSLFAKPKATSANAEFSNFWTCGHCGTVNSGDYGLCKNCGNR